jgi:hypothetical protein
LTDVDDSQRSTLTEFGVSQMNFNPAGIGNECTHWIYAALFEASALDFSRALHIAQGRHPYTWGRSVEARNVQRGDIAQFHGFQNHFFIYQVTSTGTSGYYDRREIRGPNHTGMVFTPPVRGTYYQLESHLTDPSTTRMRVRGNTIYYESFAVALSAADLAKVQLTKAWPNDINGVDILRRGDAAGVHDMLERIDWPACEYRTPSRFRRRMRSSHE